MNATLEFVATIQRERERDIERDRIARLAARVRACCDRSLFARAVGLLRPTPATR